MARRMRLEVEGGLYHLIVRGTDRQDIFHSRKDHERFLAMLGAVKEKLPFMLYAYCLMTHHLHLINERRGDTVGRIMHRGSMTDAAKQESQYRRPDPVVL